MNLGMRHHAEARKHTGTLSRLTVGVTCITVPGRETFRTQRRRCPLILEDTLVSCSITVRSISCFAFHLAFSSVTQAD